MDELREIVNSLPPNTWKVAAWKAPAPGRDEEYTLGMRIDAADVLRIVHEVYEQTCLIFTTPKLCVSPPCPPVENIEVNVIHDMSHGTSIEEIYAAHPEGVFGVPDTPRTRLAATFGASDERQRLVAMTEVMSTIMADAIEEGESVGPAIIKNWTRNTYTVSDPILDYQGLINRIAEIHATLHALANGIHLLGQTILE